MKVFLKCSPQFKIYNSTLYDQRKATNVGFESGVG